VVATAGVPALAATGERLGSISLEEGGETQAERRREYHRGRHLERDAGETVGDDDDRRSEPGREKATRSLTRRRLPNRLLPSGLRLKVPPSQTPAVLQRPPALAVAAAGMEIMAYSGRRQNALPEELVIDAKRPAVNQ